MENLSSNSNLEILIKELVEGREMATQLQNHLNMPSSSRDDCNYLLHKILYSYDRALSIIENNCAGGSTASTSTPGILMVANQDSPLPLVSNEVDQDFKDHASRKRKEVEKWTQMVKVTEPGNERQLDDGYYWRKYGQKLIFGAKHPRGYYRCSLRHGQGCLATKHVQRTDEDPTIFQITYQRKHTCDTRASPSNVYDPPKPLPGPQNIYPTHLPQNPQEPSFNIQTSLEGLGHNENQFNFPSSPTINPDILGNYSTDIFTNSTDGKEYNYFDTLESELSPIVSGITSTTTTITTSSTTAVTNFPFDSSEFGSDFSFTNQGYFP